MKEQLIELVQDAVGNCARYWAELVANRLLENGVTIREQAHWEIDCDGYYPYCSNCRHEPEGRKMTKFCENCGAEMRGRLEI